MTTFTASNGVEISLTNGGKTLFLESPGGSWPNPEEHSLLLNTDFGVALREFFRAEEDERLGRWRWAEKPSITVREAPEHAQTWPTLTVMIQNDITGYVGYYTRENLPEITSRTGDIVRAGQAYFDAHPERKPWHDAKPGETWRLTVNDRSPLEIDLTFNVIGVEGVIPSRFARPQVGGEQMEYPLDSPAITAGRRIWPEVSS